MLTLVVNFMLVLPAASSADGELETEHVRNILFAIELSVNKLLLEILYGTKDFFLEKLG